MTFSTALLRLKCDCKRMATNSLALAMLNYLICSASFYARMRRSYFWIIIAARFYLLRLNSSLAKNTYAHLTIFTEALRSLIPLATVLPRIPSHTRFNFSTAFTFFSYLTSFLSYLTSALNPFTSSCTLCSSCCSFWRSGCALKKDLISSTDCWRRIQRWTISCRL